MKFTDSQAVETYMASWAKVKGRKTIHGKECYMFGKQIFAMPCKYVFQM